jgi:toxin YoeB
MGYLVEYLSDAKEHLKAYKKAGNKTALAKIKRIEGELKEHPETGIGKPEKMKYGFSGFWSRRIDDKNRMVYKIEENIITVSIHYLMYHYEDK